MPGLLVVHTVTHNTTSASLETSLSPQFLAVAVHTKCHDIVQRYSRRVGLVCDEILVRAVLQNPIENTR